jgi:SNF family Na+-dependent transporter
MAWSVAYFFKSFTTPLPWKTTDHITTGDTESFFNPAYFSDELLNKTADISESGGLVWIVSFSLFVAYVIVYFSIWKGIESTGKVVYVAALLPYVLLFVLLIRGLTLEGSGRGLKYLFVPNWSKLGEFQVWIDGIN